MQTKEADVFLISHLATIAVSIGRHALIATRCAHVDLSDQVSHLWRARRSTLRLNALTDERFRLFYDATWELARIGLCLGSHQVHLMIPMPTGRASEG
jgi:hypothetical protein